jgi:signal transduction histidine kinase
MNPSPDELASLLSRCHKGIQESFAQIQPAGERASRLADLLLEVAPRACLSACWLRGDGPEAFAVRPPAEATPALMEGLRAELLRLDSPAELTALPGTGPLEGLSLQVAAIRDTETVEGYLLLASPHDRAAEDASLLRALLTVCAHTLALHRGLEALRKNQAELTALALVGQAFAGAAHELNNLLNSMILQTSVVQLRLDPKLRNDLAGIRQQVGQAAGIVRSLQNAAHQRRENYYRVDLNRVVQTLVADDAGLRQRVQLQLAPERPAVQGTQAGVARLVRVLLDSAGAASKGPLRVQTEQADGSVRLKVAWSGTAPCDGETPLGENIVWQHVDEIARQAGESVLRQLDGRLTVEPAEGGLQLHVTWLAGPGDEQGDGRTGKDGRGC